MTTPGHSLLPYSPLTRTELARRRQWATEEIGYHVRMVRKRGDQLVPRDLERLESLADEAEEYSSASMRRNASSAMT